MSTNIKSIRIVLPATEDRAELDLTEQFNVDGGVGAAAGFDGITAVFDDRLTLPWSLEEESTPSNPYPDGVTIRDELGYKIASQVLSYIEENDGPMTRLEEFPANGFVVVFVEDGGVDVDFISYDDRDQVRFEAVTSALGLELTVELLDADEMPPAEDPDGISDIRGVITRNSGATSSFLIDSSGYQQWGADRPVLGQTVDLLSDLTAAVEDHINEGN